MPLLKPPGMNPSCLLQALRAPDVPCLWQQNSSLCFHHHTVFSLVSLAADGHLLIRTPVTVGQGALTIPV